MNDRPNRTNAMTFKKEASVPYVEGLAQRRKGLPVRTGRRERQGGILGKGEDIDGRKIIYDGGRSGNRIKGIKVQSLSGCKGIEHRIAETRVYDSSGACKYYFLS